MDSKFLFENRKQIGTKIRYCILDKGHTLISFAKANRLSETMLKNILNGDFDNEIIFNICLYEVLEALEMSSDEVINYVPKAIREHFTSAYKVKYNLSEKAQKQYDLLLDILDLAEIYY